MKIFLLSAMIIVSAMLLWIYLENLLFTLFDRINDRIYRWMNGETLEILCNPNDEKEAIFRKMKKRGRVKYFKDNKEITKCDYYENVCSLL
jgi:hypothetical protein